VFLLRSKELFNGQLGKFQASSAPCVDLKSTPPAFQARVKQEERARECFATLDAATTEIDLVTLILNLYTDPSVRRRSHEKRLGTADDLKIKYARGERRAKRAASERSERRASEASGEQP
jgi:hypothetical protein